VVKRILLPTDGSTLSEEAVPIAADFCRQLGAELRVVSVAENPIFHGTPEATMLYSGEMYRSLAAEVERSAEAAVERAAAAARDAGVKATGVVRHGNPRDEILAEAKDWKADLVVISTHGRSGLRRLLLGSVASSVAHSAECPVLLHRATTH
jgi:nucleotide-binding universal stress UspA family protein